MTLAELTPIERASSRLSISSNDGYSVTCLTVVGTRWSPETNVSSWPD